MAVLLSLQNLGYVRSGYAWEDYVLPIKVTSTLSTAELVSGGNRTTSVKGVVERQSVLPSTSTSDAVQHFSARSLTPTGEVGLERQPNNPRHSSTATEEIEANGSAGIGGPQWGCRIGKQTKNCVAE
ncbi:unnamed protein product [Orchesella dallaii]|uniref:Uncharacterized protein n=1 Tax=Orchesella dallaii TaxID=48710 RepID=A0ABP1RXT8_9HEXA